jgi:hypothetical protein
VGICAVDRFLCSGTAILGIGGPGTGALDAIFCSTGGSGQFASGSESAKAGITNQIRIITRQLTREKFIALPFISSHMYSNGMNACPLNTCIRNIHTIREARTKTIIPHAYRENQLNGNQPFLPIPEQDPGPGVKEYAYCEKQSPLRPRAS